MLIMLEEFSICIIADGCFVLQDGETALYQAADHGQEECTQVLLEAGCDPNILTVVRSGSIPGQVLLNQCKLREKYTHQILTVIITCKFRKSCVFFGNFCLCTGVFSWRFLVLCRFK